MRSTKQDRQIHTHVETSRHMLPVLCKLPTHNLISYVVETFPERLYTGLPSMAKICRPNDFVKETVNSVRTWIRTHFDFQGGSLRLFRDSTKHTHRHTHPGLSSVKTMVAPVLSAAPSLCLCSASPHCCPAPLSVCVCYRLGTVQRARSASLKCHSHMLLVCL